MKLLITGAGGQLGQEWVQFCKNNSIRFQAFDSKALDIINMDAVQKVCTEFNPTAIINCAAYTKVDIAEDESDIAALINKEAVSNLSKICKDSGIKLVHYSTDYVFSGTNEDREKVPEGYPEDFETNPVNVYGATKRDGEIAVIESGCTFLIFRVSWLCGSFGNNFVKKMIRLGTEKDVLNIVDDQFGSPTFADQVVEQSFELIIQRKEGIFHLSSEGITTWFEFAKEVFRLKEMKVKVNSVHSGAFITKAKRPSFSKLSTKKISTIKNIKIQRWQEGLQRLINTI